MKREFEWLFDEFKGISKKEWNLVLNELEEKGIALDKIDFYSLGRDANIDLLQGYLFQEYGIEIETANKSANETANKSATIGNDEMYFWSEIVKSVNSVVIFGNKGCGKTALAHKILRYVKNDRKLDIYCFNYPKVDLIKKVGWKNIHSIEDMNRMENVALWIDEPQNYFKLYDGKTNENLAKILTLARQRNIFLIISTSMSQFVTRMLEGQIDVWCIKDCDPDTLKQGGRARKIVQDYCTLDIDGFRMENNEYLFYCRKFYDRFKGRYLFSLPPYWNDEYSKPFSEKGSV